MILNRADFFHQVTMRICGSLEIETALKKCFEYMRLFFPMQAINLNTYDSINEVSENVARSSESTINLWNTPLCFSAEEKKIVQEMRDTNVVIINRPKEHPIAKILFKIPENEDYSILSMVLKLEEKRVGTAEMYVRGKDVYTEEHAELFSVCHDPFAIAMVNALRYRQIVHLKDKLADENQYLNRELIQINGDEIIGDKLGLSNVMEMVKQVAPLDTPVFLHGETGVGKEIIANAIHHTSSRSDRPFVKVNCGAIPESLVDSELFGHEKGSFTGAVKQKLGRFERAHTGTIFLDEIGELPVGAQVRLLRVIQNSEIERVGGDRSVTIDIRIIAATNRNLEDMVRDSTFRDDLWYRLNVFPIAIPPLRQRLSDIPALVNYFIERKAREMNIQKHPVLAPGAIERLKSYPWPGNVRELENAVERALILNNTASQNQPISFSDFASISSQKAVQTGNEGNLTTLNLDEVTKNHIHSVLEKTAGKIQGNGGAADLLGLHPSTLRCRMRKLKIPFGRNQLVKTSA